MKAGNQLRAAADTGIMAGEKVFLIDGHALCYRSFYAIKNLATSKGRPTNAVFGFVRNVMTILREYHPKYLAICFDFPGKTRRQEKFAEYKIRRPPMPDDLRSQIPVIKEVMGAFRLAMFEKEGYEADDLIATLAEKFSGTGVDVVIVSDDKDLYQLAGEHVRFLSGKDGVMMDYDGVKKKLGFEPARIIDYIGLVGDQSDNIPGVNGIGPVNARQYINSFGALEDIIRHMEHSENLKTKERLIVDQKDMAVFSKELAVLDRAVPISSELGQLTVQPPDQQRLFSIFKDLEFRALAEEFDSKEEAPDIEFKTLSDEREIKNLAQRIKEREQFAFGIISVEGEGLFKAGTLYISSQGEDCYAIGTSHIELFRDVFADPAVRKVTYNVKEQFKWLSAQNIALDGEIFDVMLAGYLLEVSAGAESLTGLAWEYLKSPVNASSPDAAQVQVISRLYPVLLSALEKKSMLSLYKDIELPLARVLSIMETNGVKLDLPLLRKLSKDCSAKIDELTKTLYDLAGGEMNLNSPKQLSHVLFEKLKLPVIKRTKTGYSTDESVLAALADMHVFPSLILQYRQLAKLKSTYFDALPKLADSQTHRIHAQFNQTGTETGRLSSSQPNLQNIPIRTELGRQIRRAVIPSEKGWVILAADYSQIELRVLAHLSGDANLIKAFKDGEDIHTYTASLIFEVEEKAVTPEMRNSAKRVNFGIIYGISAFGLANDLKVPQDEAQEFIDRYFLRYPGVRVFMDSEIQKCEKTGYVMTLFNRRRYLPEINSANGAMKQFAQRQAINTPVQGSAADMLKIAMIKIQAEIERRKLSSRMISTVHDELVFELPPSEKKDLTGILREHMEQAVKLKVPVVVSVKAGPNWLDLEEV